MRMGCPNAFAKRANCSCSCVSSFFVIVKITVRKVTIYFLFHKYTITFFSKSPLKESHRQVKLKTKHEVLFGQATIKKKLQQG